MALSMRGGGAVLSWESFGVAFGAEFAGTLFGRMKFPWEMRLQGTGKPASYCKLAGIILRSGWVGTYRRSGWMGKSDHGEDGETREDFEPGDSRAARNAQLRRRSNPRRGPAQDPRGRAERAQRVQHAALALHRGAGRS